jgi:RNase P protein component
VSRSSAKPASPPASSAPSAAAAGVIPRLLRSRAAAVSGHFALHMRALPDRDPVPQGLLLLAVPKRQMVRAVDRNLVRRVAREAWRSAGLAPRPLALLLKLRRRPDWFAGAGVRRKRQALREELDQLFGHRSLANVAAPGNMPVAGAAADGTSVGASPATRSDTLRDGRR